MVGSPEPMDVDDLDSSPSIETMDENARIEVDEVGNFKSKYQKQNVFIHLLPYASELEKETEDLLDKTLLNLSKAVLARDLLSGFSLYTKSLGSYIDMYGRKFSKEQHVKLIKLMLEVLTLETLPLAIVTDVTELLQTLLKKQNLLTREDLIIEWRPLYLTLDRWVYHRKYSLSCTANSKLEAALKDTIRLCSLYFPKESLQEIIAEFSPMLCPAAIKMNFGLEMLRHFLPFQNSACEKEICEFIEFLLSFHDCWNNHPVWEWSMMNLLSSAAWNMPGKFNWDPYLSSVYARLMRNLDLPVYFKSGKSNGTLVSCKTYECGSTARWIVSTLGNNPAALNYLRTFIKSLETYYNPANAGRWTNTLANLLRELAENFTRRVKREKYLENDRWWMETPEDKKLTEEDIDVFVEICTNLALDFYLDLVFGGYVLKSLAVLRPQVVIPAVMEK
ncbi:unnamed protein product [Allacma fusca]|uniref:Proteasome activator Blm10 middle HEAT repeats region domain-containing protein n=1 Tax=Allacma fusca TaxID=39272 RepID=A0A8J2JZF2_9HEXA|nr:unnamed protein product [Allacma fusca]